MKMNCKTLIEIIKKRMNILMQIILETNSKDLIKIIIIQRKYNV